MGTPGLNTSREDRRYRALLEVSAAIATQPNLQAVLNSISVLLSKVVPFETVALLLLNESRGTVTLYALHSGHDPGIEIGTEIRLGESAIKRAIDKQTPVFVEDARQEIANQPELSSRLNLEQVHSSYAFPISTSRRKLGALIFGTRRRGEFSDEDVELMRSVASHVSVALESALALQSAEEYQRDLARERDRLRLLLEINNHIVSRLDLDELFRAASSSIRKFFANDFTGFWLFEGSSSRLKCAALDFPDVNGFLEEVEVPDLKHSELEDIRSSAPRVFTREEIIELPSAVAHRLKAENISTLVSAPLSTANRLVGIFSLGSRQPALYTQEDLDLLMQVGTQIALAVENAVAYGKVNATSSRLEAERLYLESELRAEYNFEDIVGKSAALRAVLDQVQIVAPTGSTVLLLGETGTGKELIARAIHNLSPRRSRTFVRLNCAAIPSGLVESELFGHEKGAFTGALAQKRGRFELAHEGSLFLDEIGDISLELQPKLLRALQEQEFERLGSARTIHVDVRLIAATHRDLPDMVRKGQFREDLFYRLNVFPIEIPPLRDRKEDIPLLVHYFVSRLARRMQKDIKDIPREAMEALVNWPWPGNVRELENFIERAVILTSGQTLNVPVRELRVRSQFAVPGGSSFHDAERSAILAALRAANGRLSGPGGAAERLGLKRTTLQNKMRRLAITKSDY